MKRIVAKLVVGLLLVALPAAGETTVEAAPAFIRAWGGLGTGPGQFGHPHGVAVDEQGTIYVSDTWNGRIQKFDSEGRFLTSWTGHQGMFPRGLAVSGAEVYLADYILSRVQVFSTTGTVVRIWGSPGFGPGQFDNPWGIAVDDSGNVYVTDQGNSRVQKFTSSGSYIDQWDGPDDTTPRGIAAYRSEYVYVSNYGRIYKYRTDGTLVHSWGVGGTIYFLAVDEAGNVYATDAWTERVYKYSSTGTLLTWWGTPGTGEGQFINPSGIAVDGRGHIYVAEGIECGGPACGNHRMQEFAPVATPVMKTTWGRLKALYR